MKPDELLSYTDCLLRAALAKGCTLQEAEDLTQETLLAALLILKRGGDIAYPKAFMLSTLSHKQADMLRYRFRHGTLSYQPGLPDPPYEEEGFDRLIRQEEREALRRGIAFLTRQLREVILRRYLKGESVSEIAAALGIPAGTVKSRLSAGRARLRKGMTEMEPYQKNSYEPERLHVSCSGVCGLNGEPMTVVNGDKIAQNLLILAYDRPVAEEELAAAIGIPAPYVEPIVDKLVSNELMKRQPGGKVFTDFILFTPEDPLRYLEDQKAFVRDHFDAIYAPLRDYLGAVRQTRWYAIMTASRRRKLEYFLTLSLWESALWKAGCAFSDAFPYEMPPRPNGGRWVAFGYRDSGNPAGSEEAARYSYAGCRSEMLENFTDIGRVQLSEYDTCYDNFGYYRGLAHPMEMVDMLRLLALVRSGRPLEETPLNPLLLENIPLLIQRGVLCREPDGLAVDLPLLDSAAYREVIDGQERAAGRIAEQIAGPLSALARRVVLRVPKHLEPDVPLQKRVQCGTGSLLMAAVHEAVLRGLSGPSAILPAPPSLLVMG